MFVLLNTKEDILKNVFFPTMEVNGGLNSLGTYFLQVIFFCVRQNKEINTGLELLEGE